jgi:hypothetical protein
VELLIKLPTSMSDEAKRAVLEGDAGTESLRSGIVW